MAGVERIKQLPEHIRLRVLAGGGGFMLLYTAWLIWGRQDGFERVWIGSLALVFTSLLATASALWVQKNIEPGPLRPAWLWFSAGLGLWALGDILRLANVLAVAEKTIRFTWIDAISLAGSLPVWVGLVIYPRRPRLQFGRLLTLIDTTIVTASVVTLVWMTIFHPLLNSLPSITGGDLAAPLYYPAVDLVSLLLIATLFLLSDAARLPLPLGWAGLGLAAFTLSDLALASQLSGGAYGVGIPTDLGWLAGDFLLVLAAITELAGQRSPRPAAQETPAFPTNLQRLLPLLATLALGGYTLFLWQFYGQLNQPGLWVTLVLALGLVTRQGILAGERELQKYASLVNSVAEPAFVCDPRGRLRLVNPALLAAAGFSHPSDLLGRPLQHIIDHSGTSAIIAAALHEGWSGEVHLRQSAGASIPISLALRPLQVERDSRLALAGTAHDLTEQKRQQAALQAAYEQIAADRAELEKLNLGLEQRVAEKTTDLKHALRQLEEQNLSLQQLDQLKSDFVSLVSHELRAPLTNISGGIELLLASPGQVNKQARLNLVLVQGEIKRLSRFVSSILDLSALDAGRMPLYPGPVSLPGVIQSLQKSGLPETGRVQWRVPQDLPPVLADEQALTSVLFHLLDNALKYAPQGEITVSACRDGSRLRVDVADAGPGIPADALPLIFDRFYRVDSADGRSVYGHGLGLYIVSHLLNAMKGEIQAANRPGGGACFSFWLALAEHKGMDDEL